MSVLTETITLADGHPIPKVGFGTWLLNAGDECYNAVNDALRFGYRHLDTARAYANEASVGRAIRDSGIPREQIYVTSKLPAEAKSYGQAVADFETTMAEIGLDYLDLYLVHAPWPWDEMGKDCREENKIVWRAMEEFLGSGRVKAIGVSNFGPDDLASLLARRTGIGVGTLLVYGARIIHGFGSVNDSSVVAHRAGKSHTIPSGNIDSGLGNHGEASIPLITNVRDDL